MQKGKKMSKKTCDTCVSRYICFLAGAKEPCNGWNDEGMFRGLLKTIMPTSWDEIDRALDFVKNFEVETREKGE